MRLSVCERVFQALKTSWSSVVRVVRVVCVVCAVYYLKFVVLGEYPSRRGRSDCLFGSVRATSSRSYGDMYCFRGPFEFGPIRIRSLTGRCTIRARQ